MITRRTFLGHLGAQAAAAGMLKNMAFEIGRAHV